MHMRSWNALESAVRRLLRGKLKRPIRRVLSLSAYLSGVFVVLLGVIALVPEGVRSRWPYAAVVTIVAGLGLTFAILSPMSLNEFRWLKAKSEQDAVIWKHLRPALAGRTDAWWRVAGNARGRTNASELLNMFQNCGEIGADEAIPKLLECVCDPAAYGTRVADRGGAKLRATLWRPKPLDWLEQSDPKSVARISEHLAWLSDMRFDPKKNAELNRGLFIWMRIPSIVISPSTPS
jgi:hypothetical protein